ncbi:hypothetical protein M0R01_03820 [bacterium]|nr:hypothetical protein [bacterium]
MNQEIINTIIVTALPLIFAWIREYIHRKHKDTIIDKTTNGVEKLIESMPPEQVKLIKDSIASEFVGASKTVTNLFQKALIKKGFSKEA